MDRLFEKAIMEDQLIRPGDKILVGVSGGADSMCLLDLLWKYCEKDRYSVLVLCIDHGLRPEAKDEIALVKAYCDRRKIPFLTETIDVTGYVQKQHLSTEEAARILRYRALYEIAGRENCTRIAIAHHMGDQAETVLHNLARGTGLKGLCGMRPRQGILIRPLLGFSKEQIEEYLRNNKIEWAEDSSNESDLYTRNRIRHHVIPLLAQEVNEAAAEHIAELAMRLLPIEAYLEKMAEEARGRCLAESDPELLQAQCLSVSKLLKEDAVIRIYLYQILIRELVPFAKDIVSEHYDAIDGLLGAGGSGRASLPYKIEVIREYDRLIFAIKGTKEGDFAKHGFGDESPTGEFEFRLIEDSAEVETLRTSIPQKLYTKIFDYDKILGGLASRTREPGDYITVDKEGHRQSLKQYMINEKIPARLRDKMLLLAEGDHIVWIPGYRISYFYRVEKDTKRILEVTYKEVEDGGAC